MDTPASPPKRRTWPLALLVVLGIPVLLAGILWSAVTPGWELRRLRRSTLKDTAPGAPMPLELAAGRLATGLARRLLAWTPAPPEAGVALEAVRWAEVSVLNHGDWQPGLGPERMLEQARARLTATGWSNPVRVVEEGRAVGVFLGERASARSCKVCVVVADGERTVLVMASVRPEALRSLLQRNLPGGSRFPDLPARPPETPKPSGSDGWIAFIDSRFPVESGTLGR